LAKVADAAPPFAELRLVAAQNAGSGAAIEVLLPTGRRLRVTRGFDGETLLRLVSLLESDRC